ncbi:MAG: transporter substrate-binding domain-containing protein, partial [Cyanobacteria bacterium P01_A01_bin.83]
RDRDQYRSYLTAGYGEKISNPELPLHLISSLSAKQLELAYGGTPPTLPIPEALVAEKPIQERNILAEISQTGMLKVAMRIDAAPFGYISDGKLAGYCSDFADALSDRLTEELDAPRPIKVETITSSISNRFELVEQEQAHLECGPNSIVSDRPGIVFSDPFFSSGTRFLVNSGEVSQLDLNSSLEGTKLGVLDASTSKKFLQQRYPDAEIVAFDRQDAKVRGIQAVKNGDIDALVSDGVLLTGAIDRRGMDQANYQVIPQNPLTCDYYGLILPQGDPQWRNTINNFIHNRASKPAFDRWLGNYYDQAIADLDYCQNRQEQ